MSLSRICICKGSDAKNKINDLNTEYTIEYLKLLIETLMEKFRLVVTEKQEIEFWAKSKMKTLFETSDYQKVDAGIKKSFLTYK